MDRSVSKILSIGMDNKVKYYDAPRMLTVVDQLIEERLSNWPRRQKIKKSPRPLFLEKDIYAKRKKGFDLQQAVLPERISKEVEFSRQAYLTDQACIWYQVKMKAAILQVSGTNICRGIKDEWNHKEPTQELPV